MNICFEGPYNQNSTFGISADGFQNFCCIFVQKIQNKVSVCFYEIITNCENPSSNPQQGACSGFPEAACDSLGYSENFSESQP
jgi:hypothetical protein